MKFAKLIAAVAIAAAAAPALAQTAPNDTIQLLIANGAVLDAPGAGLKGDITYSADGTFTGLDGVYTGTYKVDGGTLCSTAPSVGEDNNCVEYPDGLKSGDTFKFTHPLAGEIEVTFK